MIEMDLKVTANVKHNGKWYKSGDALKKVKKEEGERLVELGAAEEVNEKKEE
jgi:hypothetical protein